MGNWQTSANLEIQIHIIKDVSTTQCWQLDLQFAVPLSIAGQPWHDGMIVEQHPDCKYCIELDHQKFHQKFYQSEFIFKTWGFMFLTLTFSIYVLVIFSAVFFIKRFGKFVFRKKYTFITLYHTPCRLSDTD